MWSSSPALACRRPPGEHRLRHVDAHRQPLGPDRAGEVAREVAGAAGHVEHAVAGREAEQQARDPVLVVHARPEHALDRAAERRPPPALVDARHEAGEHQVLGRAGGVRPVGAEQVEVAAGAAGASCTSGRQRRARSRRRARASARPLDSPAVRLGQRRARLAARRRLAAALGARARLVEARDLALALDPRRDGPRAGRRSGCGCGCGAGARSAGWRRPSAGARPRPSGSRAAAVGLLVLAHGARATCRQGAVAWTGISSVIWSRRAWARHRDVLVVAEDPDAVVDRLARGRPRSRAGRSGGSSRALGRAVGAVGEQQRREDAAAWRAPRRRRRRAGASVLATVKLSPAPSRPSRSRPAR